MNLKFNYLYLLLLSLSIFISGNLIAQTLHDDKVPQHLSKEQNNAVTINYQDKIVGSSNTDASSLSFNQLNCLNQNGDLNTHNGGVIASNSYINANVPNWFVSHGSPGYNGTKFNFLWSYFNFGEGVFTEYNFVMGSTYDITFDIELNALGAPGSIVYVRATDNINPYYGGSNTQSPPNISPNELVYTQGWSPTGASTVSVSYTPTDDYSQLWFYPLLTTNPPSGYQQAVLQLDNVCIVQANTPPVAICESIIRYADSNCGGTALPGDFSGGSYDPDGDSITYTISPLPPYPLGLSQLTLTLDDGNGGITTCNPQIIVEDTIPPTLTCQGMLLPLNNQGTASIVPTDLVVNASDNCSFITYSLSQDQFSCADLGSTVFVVVTATDSDGNSTTCSAPVSPRDLNGICPPVAICQSLIVSADALCNGPARADRFDNGSYDPNGDPLIFSVIPQGPYPLGTTNVVLTVEDTDGLTSTCSTTITVIDDTPPTVVCQNPTVQLNASGDGSIAVSDVYGSSSDNCSLPQASIDINQFSCADVGTNDVILTVTDASGNSSTCLSTVTVEDNIAPTCIAQNFTYQLSTIGETVTFATDINNGSSDACGVWFANIDLGILNCTNIGPNTVTLTVVDNNSNFSQCTSIITVVDDLPPACMVKNITIPMNSSGVATITKSDVDDGTADNCTLASTSIDFTTFHCSNLGPNTVTFTATDVYGNTSTCSSIVTVVDLEAPVIACQNITVPLMSNQLATITPQDVLASSSDNCGIASMSLSQNAFTCFNIGQTMTVVVTVTDNSGNSSTCSADVTVTDPNNHCNQSPAAVCQNIVLPANASCVAQAIGADFDGGSTDPDGDPLTFGVTPAGPYSLGVTNVLVTVSDNAGNSSTCAATVTVNDVTPPSLSCQNINVQLDINGTATITSQQVISPSSSSSNAFINSGQSLGSFSTSDVKMADLNGDGFEDAFVTNGSNQANKVYLNDGTGNFIDTGVSLGNGVTTGVDLKDLNNDGDIDAIVSNSAGRNKVFFNNGAGIFTDSGQNLGFTTNNSLSIVLGDVDGDNDYDACLCNYTQYCQVFKNNGSGFFSLHQNFGGNSLGNGIDLADLDNDGDLDIFVANYYSLGAGNWVYLNNGTGTFTNSGQSLGTLNSSDVKLIDVDNDNDIDAFVVNLNSPNKIWLNDGTGQFTDSGQNLSNAQSGNVSFADFNSDGILDAWVGNTNSPNKIYLNNGTGTFTDSGVNIAGFAGDFRPSDVDGDGDMDAFVMKSGPNQVWLNQLPTDNCSPINYTLTPNSFSCADAGQTIPVLVTAINAAGNSSTCTSNVTVTDPTSNCNQHPTAVCQNVTLPADNNCEAQATGADFDGGSTDPDGDPLTFSVLPVGPYTLGMTNVVLTVSDNGGNSSTCAATVTVTDTTPPAITCINQTVNLLLGQTLTLDYNDLVSSSPDNCSASTTTISPATVSSADAGQTIPVTVTVTDAAGNASTCISNVTVNLLTCENLNGDLNDYTGTLNTNSNTFINNNVPNWFVSHGTPNYGGNQFSYIWSYLGYGEGVYTAYNFVQGNTYNISFDMYLNPLALPGAELYVKAVSNINPSYNGSNNTIPTGIPNELVHTRTWAPTGSSTVSVTYTPTTNHTKLWFYPYASGNPQGGEEQAFLQLDNVCIEEVNEAPIAVCQNITLPADNNCEAQATGADFDGGSSDPDGDPLTFAVTPAGPYTIGTTSVVLTVTDLSGASSTCGATITVDPNPPVLTCPAAPAALQNSYNISNLNTGGNEINGLVINGVAPSNRFGRVVNSAGDFNGDGYPDFVIAAPSAAALYVFYGPTNGFPSPFDASNLNGTNGFIITGVGGYDFSSAGDINGDGYDDLIIGQASNQVYLIYGTSNSIVSLDVTNLNGTNGFQIVNPTTGDQFGISARGAGDFNNDGYDDMIVGDNIASPNGKNRAGQAFVIFGKATPFPLTFDVNTLSGINGFRIDGIAPNDELGLSTNSAGDFNNDGISDIILGASGVNTGPGITGASYLIFGSTSNYPASFDLTTLNGNNGFVVNGVAIGDQFGTPVEGGGDYNGDGIDDLVIGAQFADPNGINSGACYVVYGHTGPFTPMLQASGLNGTNGFRVDGISASSAIGRPSGNGGDINGDGFDDLIVGAINFSSGKVFVVYGSPAGGSPSIQLSNLNGTNGFYINEANVGDGLGRTMSGVGDMNGDGYDDFLLGANNAITSGTNNAGQAYIVYGFPNTTNTFTVNTDPSSCDAVVTLPLATATGCSTGTISITNSYNSGGADASDTYPLGTTTVVYTATDANGNSSTCSIDIHVEDPNFNCPLALNAKVLLSGPYDQSTSLMDDDLRSLGHLPLTHPYSMAPFNYAGTEMTTPAILAHTGNDAIVDWVLVELRDKNNSATILKQKAGLLQRDGDVVDENGMPLLIESAAPDDYYVAIRHRNHLGAMTLNPMTLSYTPMVVDFTSIPTHGTNAMKIVGGTPVLWGGDANSDGTVDSADRSIGWNQRNQTGYLTPDANLDGTNESGDRSIMWNDRNKTAQLP